MWRIMFLCGVCQFPNTSRYIWCCFNCVVDSCDVPILWLIGPSKLCRPVLLWVEGIAVLLAARINFRLIVVFSSVAYEA